MPVFVKVCCIINPVMSNKFESRNREAFDPSTLRRSMAERDPERVHFEHKYGDDSDYLDKEEIEKRVAKLKANESVNSPNYYKQNTENEVPSNTEEKPADLSRITEHDELKGESFNQAGQIASGFINEAILKAHGISKEEFNSLKKEDREFLVDELSKKNSDYEGQFAPFKELGWEKEDLTLFSKNDKELILDRNINKKSFNESDFQMRDLGYSLNQIFFVISNNDKEKIIQEKIKPEDWVKVKRSEMSTPTNDKKSFRQWLSAESNIVSQKSSGSNLESRPGSENERIKILNFQLKTFERDFKKAEKVGDIDQVGKLKEDIKKVREELGSSGSKLENVVITKKAEVKTPEAFIGGEEKLGLEDSLKSESSAEQVGRSQEEVQQLSSTVETNIQAKEGSAKKYIQDLGYSKEEILALPVKDQNRIVEEQIPRNAWFREETVAPIPEVLPTPEIPENKEKKYIYKETNVGTDGSYTRTEEEVDLKELKVRLENRSGQRTSIGNSKEQEAKGKAIEEYKIREAELSKMGWTLEKYSALSEREQQMVIWQHLPPEQVLEEGRVNTSENKSQVEEMTVDAFIEYITNKRDKLGEVNFTEEDKAFIRKNKEVIRSKLSKPKEESVPLPKKEDIEPLPKEAEDYIKAKINKDRYDLSAKGTSEGAKEFLADQKLLVGIPKGYENLGKNELIEKLKERQLPSGGDKQKITERLAKDDIEKKTPNFGFAETELAKKLKEEFNLSEKDIILLSPEFFSLSPAKQQYLFSKLEQKIYLDADFASKTQNEEEIQKMGFWKKLGSSFVKGQRQVALRDKMIQEIKKGGIKDYRLDIKTLNDYLLDAPELKYELNEKGRLAPHFEYVETTSSDKKFETPKVFFNVAASRFSEMPFEWSLKSATDSQRQAYQKAYSSYTGAKESLLKAMIEEAKYKNPNIDEEGEKNIRKEALIKIAETDARVKFGTFITQNPEMENLSANFFEKVLGAKANDFARGAMFTGAGFATKWLGRSMAVTGVGLAVSGAVGGLMAYRKKNLEYKEKELQQRYGKEVNDLLIKKAVNSSNVYERLEKLVGQLEKTTDKESKKKIVETIKTRIFVTEEMMRDGRINFGSQKEQTLNQYKLSEMMSKAAVTVEMEGGFGPEKTKEEKVFDRFKQFVQDDAVQKEKDVARALAFFKGVSVGVLGYEVGMGLRYAQEAGFFSGAWEAISEKGTEGLKKAKEIISNFFSDDTPTSLPKAPNLSENVTPVETVMAGSRGVIGAIDDMQDNLKLKFGNNVPEQYREFLSKDPNKLAREWGFYKPGEVNESAIIKKGEGFSIDSKGIVRFVGLNGTDEVYVPQGVKDVSVVESERKFFDGGRIGLASAESPSIETEATYVESEPVKRPEAPNEGYATTKEVKPGPTNWFEKPVPTERGYSSVRGSWKFAEGPDGQIKSVNLAGTLSERANEFLRTPNKFISPEAPGTDSTKVYLLRQNAAPIVELIKSENLLNDSTVDLTDKERVFLQKKISADSIKIKELTKGAFAGSQENIKIAEVPKPEKITYFGTDEEKPKINPSVTSVSEGSDFVPRKEAVPVPETSAKISGKTYEVSFGDRAGKKFIPVTVESSWNLEDNPVLRNEALNDLVNPAYHKALKFNPDFDRLVVAEEILESNKYAPGTSEHEALKNYINGQKIKISQGLRANDVFEMPSGPIKVSLNGVEYISSNTDIPQKSEMVSKIAKEYITGSKLKYVGNLMALGEDHIGIYEESSNQGVANEMINSQARLNGDKVGSLVEEKMEQTSDGKYRIIKVYKLKK